MRCLHVNLFDSTASIKHDINAPATITKALGYFDAELKRTVMTELVNPNVIEKYSPTEIEVQKSQMMTGQQSVTGYISFLGIPEYSD